MSEFMQPDKSSSHMQSNTAYFYYIDTDEIPGFLLSLKSHITSRSKDTIFIFHM